MSSLQRDLDKAFVRNAEAEAVANDLQRQVELAVASDKPAAVVETLKRQLASALDTCRGTWTAVNEIREAMHR